MCTGQVARDMRENGARYGFVSTYEETVILKIAHHEDDSYSLLYSDIIPHNQSIIEDYPGGPLSKVTVKCALTYLIYRASHDDGSWSVEPSAISDAWFGRKRISRVGKLAGPYRTTFVPAWKENVRKRNSLRATRQKFENVTIGTPTMTPTPAGVSPDDPKDMDWEDLDTSDDDTINDDDTFARLWDDTPSAAAAARATASRVNDARLGRLDVENDHPVPGMSRRNFGQVAQSLRQAGARNNPRPA